MSTYLSRWLKKCMLFMALSLVAFAVSAQSPYLAVNGANHDYLTLNYYINEPSDFEMVYLDFYPNEGNVEMAQIWANVNRRDRATLGDQDFASIPGPGPGSTNYFVGYPMTNAGGGKWVLALPVNKTGAYRLTARYKLNGQNSWKWVGGRDTAVMVSPKKSRDVILYETQVNVINATGDSFGTRSTFEDMMNPAKPGNLQHFKNLGINTLWIQPIHPIGSHYCVTVDGPGSPYSIQNMWEVAPFHSQGNTRESSMIAFSNFAAAAKAEGIDFFFDIIFNHTSWDAEIGRNPDNPEQPAANPLAKIKDILPQWYSRYNSTDLPCGEYSYNQANFAFTLPAQNANQIGPAPAERNDFGKWPDVADLFWGVYPSLLNPQTDTDAYWDVSQTGADVKRMTEYFAYFGKYWIEKSGGTLGGFRCDYAQGLPPQAWEFLVNKIRQTKWDFIFMAESLDGGNVSKRAGRHMDIINQNWVWQVLENGGNTTGFRGIIDANKTDYGYAGIMRGLINHDQNAPEDVWYSFSRYAVGAVIDGAPQLYQGQELGYRNNYGFSQFRNQFDRWIPHIFKWHNMQTLWNNRIGILEDAYRRVNKGRMANIATRLHDQWYLDQMNNAPHQQIFAVMKYERFGWDPAHQNVVLNFVNLTPWTQRQGTFKLNLVDGGGNSPWYLNPTRLYNVRNLTSDNPNQQVWAQGRTGQDLIDNGIFIDMPADGNAHPDRAFVQMLKLEEHGGVPPEPYVSINPTNPVGCGTIAIRYKKTGSPLGAGPVYIHIGRNGWQDVIMPNPQLANDGDYWVYYANPLPGTTNLNFVFNNGSGSWDNNSGQDWNVTVTGCTGSVPVAVWTVPETVANCEPVTIYYDAAGRVLASANPVYIHIGRNGWTNMITPTPAMTLASNSVWMYTYTPTTGTETINFVFNDGNPNTTNRVWDNNGGNDWSKAVAGCGSEQPQPDFAITVPAANITVANNISNYTIQGVANNMSGTLAWTNALTGGSGTLPVANPWLIPLMPLNVGTNVITVRGTTSGGGGGVVTNAQDNAGNYGGGWTTGSNQGTGFSPWTLESGGQGGHFVGANGWGFWSHEGGGYSAAVRPFPAAMAAGQTFRVRMQNGWIWEAGGSVGVALRDTEGDEKWLLYFNGGATNYTGTNPTDIPWTDQGLDIAFTLTAANSYSVTITPVAGGSARTYTGSFTGSINNFRAWSANNGTGDEFNSNRDYFVNNLMITSAGGGGGGATTSDTVIIVRQASGGADSNGDGVPDSWYIQYGMDPTVPNQASMMAVNGMTYGQSFLAGLNPTNPDDFFGFNLVMASTSTPGRAAMRWNAKPERSYRAWASRDGVDGPYTNEVATRTTVGGTSYNIVIEDAASGQYPHSFYRLELIESGSGGGGGGGGGDPVIVNATPGSTVFTNVGGISVTLSVSGGVITNARYTIQGDAPVTFTNGQVVVIGADFTNGQSKTLTLLGQNSAGNSDQKVYTYSRASGITLTTVEWTSHWPENGSITTNSEIWVNTSSLPPGAGVSADIVYCAGTCEGAWPLVPMNRNEAWDPGVRDWWNANLGTYPAGTIIQYAVVVRDAQGNEVWDSNNGQNYTAIVNGGGGGGGGEQGGFLPPSTNPTFGQFGTKTVDGVNNGEWTTNNLIALDLANDDPRSLGSNWTMHETPADLTHLWAAWDNDNLYLAFQFVDITSIIDPSNWNSGDAIGNNQGILHFISIDTGPGGAVSNMWAKNDKFTGATLPNYQLAMRADLWAGASFISKAVNGVFPVDDGGVNYKSFAAAGIQVARTAVFAADSLWGVPDVDDFLNNPNVPLTNYTSRNTTRDAFYEISIPLSELGLTRATLEANGVGVFINTGSQSSLDTIPHDNATINTPGVEVWNSSLEWSDTDLFTSPFARVVK
ncbi:MAG TPA: carbohydrate-binding protein [Kiritimatiellia bacterium]|nr:carbohydrate-binding protein [Kiritimatiellia bacterium]HMO98253.1 carbohydrate-binding protein [Kiritimatiellia bacterium]HMP96598.1 carbohydrate-binding protein [Kiritimatiellia bacterium]